MQNSFVVTIHCSINKVDVRMQLNVYTTSKLILQQTFDTSCSGYICRTNYQFFFLKCATPRAAPALKAEHF